MFDRHPPAATVAAATLLLALAGCASTQTRHAEATNPATDRPADPPVAQTRAREPSDLYAKRTNASRTKAVRTSRYQLVTLAADPGQRDLLKQTIKVDLPAGMNLSVADGMQHVLKNSGMRLCPDQRNSSRFDTALPAVDRHLGPTTLGNALQVLAGPAWELTTNYATRKVCFQRRTASEPQSKQPDGGGQRSALAGADRD